MTPLDDTPTPATPAATKRRAGEIDSEAGLIEHVARAMFEDCMDRRYEELPGKRAEATWPPMRELAWEWRQHARAAIAALSPGGGR